MSTSTPNSHQPNVDYAELLRVTASKNDKGTLGDRVPAIFSTGTGTLILRTQINDEADWYFNNKAFQVKEKTWYSIEIAQYKENNKVSPLTYLLHMHLLMINLSNLIPSFLLF